MTRAQGRAGESRRDALLRENERLRHVLKGLTSTRRYTVAAAIAKEAVKYGLIGFFSWLSVKELAGKVTVLDAAVDMCTSLTDSLKELVPSWIVQILTVAVLITCVALVRRTRARNTKLIKRIAAITKRQEEAQDRNRTSSKLGFDGETGKGDGI